jgi:hypothetical protein
VTGWTQELPAQRIGACYGDAFWAGLATGQVELSDLHGAWVQIERRFAPDPARHVLYQEYYGIYRDLYRHTVEDVHALAKLGSRGTKEQSGGWEEYEQIAQELRESCPKGRSTQELIDDVRR